MQKIILATRQDKDLVVALLVRSFDQDPQMNWYIGTGPNRDRRLRMMMEFAFEQCLPQQSIYLTADKQAVAIWRFHQKDSVSLRMLWTYAKFIGIMGLKRLKAIMQLDEQIHANYPQKEAFWYLWILGVTPESQGQGLSSQLLDHQLQQADEQAIPCYLETSVEKNVRIYERRGYEVYQQLELASTSGSSVPLFLLKRQPIPVNNKKYVPSLA